MLNFERRHEKLAPLSVFFQRVLGAVGIAIGLAVLALALGILGYHFTAGYEWIDSLLEASMILGGMGPIKELPNDGAKIFASLYALFSGLVFIAVMGVVLSPLVHRILHNFHVDDDEEMLSEAARSVDH